MSEQVTIKRVRDLRINLICMTNNRFGRVTNELDTLLREFFLLTFEDFHTVKKSFVML